MLMLLTLARLRKIFSKTYWCRKQIYFFLLSLHHEFTIYAFFLYRYSMVLADNVDGGDDLDLIVSTMNGNVFCFSTPAPHHPLKVLMMI